MAKKWRFSVDRGGTFTDVVGVAPDESVRIGKTPSAGDGAELRVLREWLGVSARARIPAGKVAEIRIGSTVCTNALLERRGAKTAVAVTKGFADTLVIGDQTRPSLFDLAARRLPPLWSRAVEIDERIGANGENVRALDADRAAKQFAKLKQQNIQALAIALVHGCKYPQREKTLARIAKQCGIETVVASHEAAALMKFVPRAQTAAADAYLAAALANYANAIRKQCEKGVRIFFMHSGGDLADMQNTRAAHAVLSGPAGGVVGMRAAASAAGFARAVGLDMGGTSADVALADTAAPPSLRWENNVAGVPLFAPMLDIHTVAAGGGSIVRVSGGRLLAGPRSAGADPGPACYGRGGPLTVSDCNVILGKLRAAHFPKVFGKNNDAPLDESAAKKMFAQLANKNKTTPEKLARGFIQVAVANIADAVRAIAAAAGADVRKRALVGFGGAAGQHLCLVADSLGITRALAPRQACVLSAWGIGKAEIGAVKRRALECNLNDARIEKVFAQLQKESVNALPAHSASKRKVQMFLRCRYRGVESALAVPWHKNAKNIATLFAREHKKTFGWIQHAKEIIAAAAEVRAAYADPPPPDAATGGVSPREAQTATHTMHCQDGARRTPFYDWRKLRAGCVLRGPAVVADEWNTVVVEPGWHAKVQSGGALALNKIKTAAQNKNAANKKSKTKTDPALLEIFNNRFTAAAREMGEALQKTATSVNIRERLDFSCAIFDGDGNLVANAPHIPVHLGSMSESARFVLRRAGAMRGGDAFMLNSPYAGGTHLPDITVVRPLWLRAQKGKPDILLAARGHHADIGGVTPASMPADSTRIEEEGVLLPLTKIVNAGKFCEKTALQLLNNAKYPARNAAQNIADLRAQTAALAAGAQAMQQCAGAFGVGDTLRYLKLVQDNAAACARELLPHLRTGRGRATLDDGSVIDVRVRRENGRAIFDFSGASPRHAGNFNAPASVVRAAVIYCLRALLGADIPLNDGIMRRVKLIIPRGSMLRASPPCAVAAGNVETSQNIVDAVFAALGVCANSQGTCNNFTIGFANKQYYETICGGGGASSGGAFFAKGFDGGDAMQTHMTNSRATDVEVLEMTLPVRLQEFSFRRNSGGAGVYRGGWGAIRRIVFLQNGSANILSSHRKIPPAGLNGGGNGKPGVNAVRRANGKLETLPACAAVKMHPGDEFIIKTPGGGGANF